jgi:hypothetical protein
MQKKVSLTITWEEDKLSALRLYLAEKDIQVEDALVKALESLYAKAVPQQVQHYLELRSGMADNAPTKPKQEAKPTAKPEKTTEETEVSPNGKPGDRPLAG